MTNDSLLIKVSVGEFSLDVLVAQEPDERGKVLDYLKERIKEWSMRKKQGAGRKPSHELACREQPEPDKTIEVLLDNCIYCGGELGDPSGKKTRPVTDIPNPEPPKTTNWLF